MFPNIPKILGTSSKSTHFWDPKMFPNVPKMLGTSSKSTHFWDPKNVYFYMVKKN